jgi:DNA-binding CsgD family transcriptional regulator
MKLTAITRNALNAVLMRKEYGETDYRSYFAPAIEQATRFAPAPFCWFIPETNNMTIVEASNNMQQLTPHTTKNWVGQGIGFWFAILHPDDVDFVMSAVAMTAKINETPPIEISNKLNSNIYCRMLDATNQHRWVLIQFPQRLYNEQGKVISCLVMTTDLSHLAVSLKTMMTVVDLNSNKSYYYNAVVNTQKLVDANLPVISKREREVVQLMAKGLNTPQIANHLFIAYDTVENHKRNLRKKTQTKTAAALMNYVWENNLL